MGRPDQLHGAFRLHVAPGQDGLRLRIIGQDDDRAQRVGALVAVEMEAGDVALRDLVVHAHAGIRHHVASLLLQHGLRGGGHVIVPMGQPLDQPARLQVHKHGVVIGRARACQHPGDAHFQRIHPGHVKHLLLRRKDGVAGF